MQTYHALIFSLKDKDGNPMLRPDGKKAAWAGPPTYQRTNGVNPPDALVVSWPDYLGDLALVNPNCDGGGEVPTVKPVWSTLTPPPLIPGKDYIWTVPFTSATAADGHSIADYDALIKPAFLSAGKNSQGEIVLSGSVPANLNVNQTYNYEFKTTQDNGAFATYTNFFPIQSTLLEGLVQFQDAQDQAIVRISPNMEIAPIVSLKKPGGTFSTPAPATKGSSAETVLNKQWWFYSIFTGLTTNGIHIVKIEGLSQILYGSFLVSNGNVEAILNLTATEPTTEVYVLVGDATIQKGQTKTYELKNLVGETAESVGNETYELLGAAITGVSLTSGANASLTLANNANVTNGQTLTIISKVGGVEKGRLVVTVSVPVVQVAEITGIDWRWIRTKAGDPWAENQFYIYFQTSNGGQIEFDLDGGPFFGAGIVTHYDPEDLTPLTNDSKGYQYVFTTNGFQNLQLNVKARIAGRGIASQVEVNFRIPPTPSLSTERVQIYPTGSSNPTEPPPPGTAVGVPAQTHILKSNPDIFNPVVYWENGAWHVRDSATPEVPPGYTKYYFFSGATGYGSMPFNSFNPGDELQIYFSISQTPSPYTSIFNRKSEAFIIFGQAPSN
ncbi:hypothetical protein IC229_27510 [Spirosoma sp. BT702]|uniref:Uncharacterized protein n=1 Tax=Spirosoma profusum TaxID=2771354 RepID=A0A926Y0K1_9BACT|nr:hypothetical protein [Spirosoma profusum]MBD2704419.1 hypothetical protein [Spirosoma profusum]